LAVDELPEKLFDLGQGLEVFLFSRVSTLAVGLSQRPVKLVRGGYFPQDMTMTTELHIVPSYAFMVYAGATLHFLSFTLWKNVL
jgi:hypothetical protein